ncbi:hypothetical protein Q9L58_007958, partial [Maublancomyces gigas]
TCFAVFYIIITYALYFDNKLPKHLAALTDTLFLAALTAISIIIGAPLSTLTCGVAAAANPSTTFDPTATFTDLPSSSTATTTPIDPAYLTPESGTVFHPRARREATTYVHMEPVAYGAWVESEVGVCGMMKAVWGLVFALM